MLKLGLSKRRDFYLPTKETPDYSRIIFEETQNSQAITICRKRMLFAIGGFALIYLIIAVRVFGVCLANGIHILHTTDEEQISEIYSGAPISRADITDCNGAIIATSLPTVNLYANPKQVRNPEDVAEKLSLLFPDISYNDLLAKLTRKRTVFSMIKHNLSPSQQAEVNKLGIPALEFQNSEKRVYPHENLFAHLLGYTNIDNLGLAGVEKFMHKRLTESSKPLELTVNMGIQDTIREELLKAVEKYKARGASAILMNANTGEVISMVSVPDYNPNLSIPVGKPSLFNFTTQGVYEAGSVLKTFNTALSLESGKVKMKDKFDATKPIKIGGVRIADYRGKNRWLSVEEILVHSSNIGSAQMASIVGKEAQRQFMINLLFSESLTDFEVVEKGRPLFPDEKNWRDSTMATAAYGYGLSVTPLHLISAFSAIINGGIYHYPTLLKSASKNQPRRIISAKTSANMRKMLRQVVIEGSGKKADIAGYQVIGKTGTANKLINGKYIDKKVMTSFLSAFPASNPQYALLVVMDEPKETKETWGFVTSGYNAVPTTGNIISAIAPQLDIQADFTLDEQRQHVKAAFTR